MKIGIPAETRPGETRVAATPETVKKLAAKHQVIVESGAGLRAAVIDEAYVAAGATIGSAQDAFGADVVLKVRAPDAAERAQMKTGAALGGKFIDVPFLTDEEKEIAQGAGGYARAMPADWMRRQAELVHERAKLADIIITTALIPGRAAPVLISEETVKAMKPGSVIV